MSDLNLDSKSWEQLTEEFAGELSKRASEPATNGELAIVLDIVRCQDSVIVAQSKRLEFLERRPAIKFVGTYSDSKTYEPGDASVRQGGLWICKAATSGPFDHARWTLAVKRGDAR